MRVTVEQIDPKHEEELIVRCHDPGASWVEGVREAASGQRTVCGWREDTMHRLFGRIMVFTLIALLSLAVYYSKEELTVKAWWMRTVLHLLLLEAVLLPLAHTWGFWQSGTDILIYAGFILLAEALWHLVDYSLNAKTAAQINEKIRKNRMEKRAMEE